MVEIPELDELQEVWDATEPPLELPDRYRHIKLVSKIAAVISIILTCFLLIGMLLGTVVVYFHP